MSLGPARDETRTRAGHMICFVVVVVVGQAKTLH